MLIYKKGLLRRYSLLFSVSVLKETQANYKAAIPLKPVHSQRIPETPN